MLLLSCLMLSQTTSANLPVTVPDEGPLPSLAPMLEKINPAVVNIATYSTKINRYNPLLNDPFFRRFFNIPDEQFQQYQQPERKQQSAGSGVILNAADGIVVTNYHVIKGSDEVQVSLIDGRSFAAEIVGSDPELDIATLKIRADGLSEIKVADSSRLRVGDFVVAIGNPFGLGQTVTTGIVSALGRSGLGIEGYENFIQTDASINPGNSGGALVNLRGELVGINTAIIAPAGGNVGIGFAIPANMVNASMHQLLAYGEVKRGDIGIAVQDITPALSEAFDLRNGQRGVLITQVDERSPAAAAGIEPGDIITQINGVKTVSAAHFRSLISMTAIDDMLRMGILRHNKTLEIGVRVAAREDISYSGKSLHPLLEGAQFENNPQGGVVVTGLKPNSRAAYNGIRPDDIIVSANRVTVHDVDTLRHALSKDRSSVLLKIIRDNLSLYLVIR
ncbi:Do family serine endopeptidase [Amphritea atlantica]|uniref:Do family serine endopeptidase n=1 Tax=Amphritea atlantica TaxID=355243 RepID=A0ABY5H016_9GAMM|nr:Do family serine endopeptidase [Amphritea atlantica]